MHKIPKTTSPTNITSTRTQIVQLVRVAWPYFGFLRYCSLFQSVQLTIETPLEQNGEHEESRSMRTNLRVNTRHEITAKNKSSKRSKASPIEMSKLMLQSRQRFQRWQTTCQNQQTIPTFWTQSEAFEILREITDDVQESSSSPFTYVSSKSTTAQNRVLFVSPTEDPWTRRRWTSLYKRRYSTRATSNSLNNLSWQLSLPEHEHMKTLAKSVSRKFLQVCSSV